MGVNAVYTPYNTIKGFAGALLAGTSAFTPLSSNTMVQQKKRTGQSYTKVNKKRKRPTKGISLKKAIMNTLPAKHFTAEDSFNMTHNTLYTCVPTMGVTQGTTNSQREGDRIRLLALKLKATLQSASTANSYTYRVIVGYSGEEWITANLGTKFVAGAGATELYLPTTSTNWMASGIINPKAFTCLYDRTIDINSQITATVDGFSFADTIQLDSDFSYQSTGSVYGKTRNLCVIVSGSVAGGVAGVTASGAMIPSLDLIFKD